LWPKIAYLAVFWRTPLGRQHLADQAGVLGDLVGLFGEHAEDDPRVEPGQVV